ncbi:DUF305 domain-containing protein, partial [Streptomyces somaliensis]
MSSSKCSLVRRTAAAAAAGAAAVLLTACGGNGDGTAGQGGHTAESPSAAASQGRHNAADVAFARAMIPHHRQAVEMAALAPGRAESAQVAKLAEDIRKAQDPEIETMSGWLASWGVEVPEEGAADHSAHGDGMMTAGQMAELQSSSGKEFDTAFMEMMIKHHEGLRQGSRGPRGTAARGRGAVRGPPVGGPSHTESRAASRTTGLP